jgi:hypothetical protein
LAVISRKASNCTEPKKANHTIEIGREK